MNKIELKRLKYFVAVAEERHFGKAAQRLHMSQPPLSEQIRKLEEELEVQLFLRSQQGATLTAAGAVLLEGVHAGIQHINDAVRLAQLTQCGTAGVVTIGFISSASLTLIPHMVREFSELAPQIEVQLKQYGSSHDIEKALVATKIDLGLLRAPVSHSELTVQHLFNDPMLLAVPSDHPFASRESVLFSELARERFILFASGQMNLVNLAIQRCCEDAGFHPVTAQFVDDIYAMLGLVASNLGIAIVPSSIRKISVEGMSFVPINSVDSHFPLALGWRQSESVAHILNAANIICDIFKSYVNERATGY